MKPQSTVKIFSRHQPGHADVCFLGKASLLDLMHGDCAYRLPSCTSETAGQVVLLAYRGSLVSCDRTSVQTGIPLRVAAIPRWRRTVNARANRVDGVRFQQ